MSNSTYTVTLTILTRNDIVVDSRASSQEEALELALESVTSELDDNQELYLKDISLAYTPHTTSSSSAQNNYTSLSDFYTAVSQPESAPSSSETPGYNRLIK
jgi:hypothetical protein